MQERRRHILLTGRCRRPLPRQRLLEDREGRILDPAAVEPFAPSEARSLRQEQRLHLLRRAAPVAVLRGAMAPHRSLPLLTVSSALQQHRHHPWSRVHPRPSEPSDSADGGGPGSNARLLAEGALAQEPLAPSRAHRRPRPPSGPQGAQLENQGPNTAIPWAGLVLPTSVRPRSILPLARPGDRPLPENLPRVKPSLREGTARLHLLAPEP